MAGLITPEMYRVRLGRALTADQTAQVEALIQDASALVRRIAEGALDAIDSLTVPADVVPVVVAMVRRAVDNPRGLTSERLGDYQWTGAGQAIYATDEEAAIVRRAVGLSVIGEVTLTNDIPDRLRLDPEGVPGLTGFDYSDF